MSACRPRARPDQIAIICGDRSITYAGLDARADRIAAALQRDGVRPGGVVSVCAASSIDYMAVFIGTLRTGAAIAPLSPSATPDQLVAMIADCGASHLATDAAVSAHLSQASAPVEAHRLALEDGADGTALDDWMAAEGSRPETIEITPDMAFNIIYSSGTTGEPKGIVQSFKMRWPHNHLGETVGFGPEGCRPGLDAALFQHHAGACPADPGRWWQRLS